MRDVSTVFCTVILTLLASCGGQAARAPQPKTIPAAADTTLGEPDTAAAAEETTVIPKSVAGLSSVPVDPVEILEVRMTEQESAVYRARALNMMCVLWGRRHESDRVEKALTECAALEPANPYYLAKLGFLLLRSDGKRIDAEATTAKGEDR